jgi:hypothetical protein
MNISQALTDPVRPRSRAFAIGLLVSILALLAFDVWWRITLPAGYRGNRDMNLVVIVMLLLNCLASQFRWSRGTTATLRILS